MKKFVFLIAAITIAYAQIAAQPCLPDGITFNTQAQIDNFQTNYPGCTEIEGNVTIEGSDITNLNGLSILTSIGGNFMIGGYADGNPSLTGLTGLDNLTSIGGYLWIKKNTSLTSLTGLEGLISIGNNLEIWHNNALNTLAGLDGLTSIAGILFIEYNSSLTSLAGLEGLTTIGGDLLIGYHIALTSLAGLDNIEAGSITDLVIKYNTSLSNCAVQSICDYLAAPTGTVDIAFNAPGCNSPAEINAACETLGLEELIVAKDFRFFPNPFTTHTTIEFDLPQSSSVSIQIFNTMGAMVDELYNDHLPSGEQQFKWNSGDLPKGLYYCRVQAGNEVVTRKIIKH